MLDIEFAELIEAVMESLDPTPEMPPEVRYKRSSERKTYTKRSCCEHLR